MKLTKTTTAMLIAGTIGVTALTAPLWADGGKNCESRHHGKGHFSMMGGHGKMNKNPERMIEKMSRKLDLSDEQREQALAKLDELKPQLKEAQTAMRDGMKRLHDMDSNTANFTSNLDEIANEQGKLVADMIKLRTTMFVEFEEILTEEQKVKLNEFRKKRGRHHKQGDDSEENQS